jgi:hypothetical protein
MTIDDKVRELRKTNIKKMGQAVPAQHQGVTKERITAVLERLDLANNMELIDTVFALLDDNLASWFPAAAKKGLKFCHGASTAHIGCHVGILQRNRGKLDREGRDFWIKPLRDLGGIELVHHLNGEFVDGHPIAKSSNSSYRLNPELVAILKAPDEQWEEMIDSWCSDDEERQRLAFQAQAVAETEKRIETGHSALIKASVEIFATHFLGAYEVIYVDDGDGDRITKEQRENLAKAGIELTLVDAMPDVLLWNPVEDSLWVIEAVTSDGEVDNHKVRQIMSLAERCNKSSVGFTTTYRSWKEAATRQKKNRNIAIGTYIWIEDDPTRHQLVESSTSALKVHSLG